MSCFGRKKTKQKDVPVEVIIKKLDETESILAREMEDLEQQIQRYSDRATESALTNQRASIRALEKIKRLEINVQKIDKQITALDVHRDALRNSKTNEIVLDSIRVSGEYLRNANKKLEEVSSEMDNIAEQHCVSDEIADTIRTTLVSTVDTSEVEEEFRKLHEKELNKSIIAARAPPEDDHVFANIPDESKGEKGAKKINLS